MSYINFNPNPDRKLVGDCVIRAISKAMNQSWDDTYIGLMLQGYSMHDMPSSNDVWGRYLFEHGFRRYIIPDTCPDCYTVRQFCSVEYVNGTVDDPTITPTPLINVVDGSLSISRTA